MAEEVWDPRRGGGGAPMDRYWDWVAVACYLLFSVDMLTTLFAAAVVGVGAEGNPLVQAALEHGPMALLALNLGALVLAVLFFYGLRLTVEHSPASIRPHYARFVTLWVVSLAATGLFVFANNLSVIVLHRSLLPG